MELDIPFVGASSLTTYPIPLMHHHLQLLGHGSPFAVIPDEIKAKVAAYGKGMMSSWTPQQVVLDHPALGCFVTHGGHNSVTEAIISEIPL